MTTIPDALRPVAAAGRLHILDVLRGFAIFGILQANILMFSGPLRLLMAFAPVGRMALTNYVLQSVICTFVFYGYGLGLYGKVGTTSAVPMPGSA